MATVRDLRRVVKKSQTDENGFTHAEIVRVLE